MNPYYRLHSSPLKDVLSILFGPVRIPPALPSTHFRFQADYIACIPQFSCLAGRWLSHIPYTLALFSQGLSFTANTSSGNLPGQVVRRHNGLCSWLHVFIFSSSLLAVLWNDLCCTRSFSTIIESTPKLAFMGTKNLDVRSTENPILLREGDHSRGT